MRFFARSLCVHSYVEFKELPESQVAHFIPPPGCDMFLCLCKDGSVLFREAAGFNNIVGVKLKFPFGFRSTEPKWHTVLTKKQLQN